MITEEHRKKIADLGDSQVRKECQEIVKSAGVYERLEANQDWIEHKKHLEDLTKIHKGQIDGWMGQMAAASFFKRLKMLDVALVHQIRKEQLEEWINYPSRIIQQANQAREILADLRKKEKANNGRPN